MKNVIALILLTIVATSCKEEIKTNSKDSPTKNINYPTDMVKIFDNHGGLANWKSMKSLSYEIVKDGENEKQFIDLQNRRERIEAATFSSGYDGTNYWLEADTSYNGNAKFYTNLMFYFYAMPFVLADEGIKYEPAKSLTFDNKSWPGYRISYGDGIGLSPQDEYYIHYDPETYEMAWLGYTVTFYSGKKSNKTSYIRYNDWKDINGLKLPNSLTWYKVEDGKILEPRNTRKFSDIKISKETFNDAKFQKTQAAIILE